MPSVSPHLPTVAANVDGAARLARNETSGPVATNSRVSDSDETPRIASTGSYGPALSERTHDAVPAMNMTSELRYGYFRATTHHVATP